MLFIYMGRPLYLKLNQGINDFFLIDIIFPVKNVIVFSEF